MTLSQNFDVFIRGKIIDLVVLNIELIESTNWYKWFNDEETTTYMQKHYFPNTKRLQSEYFINEIKDNNNKLQLGIVSKKDQIMIGIISLNDIDHINRKCETSCVIGEKKYRDMKNYIEAYRLIIKHGFDTLNMNRISGGTIKKELEDILCKFLGFKSEGILRESVYKNGKYYDTHFHSILYKDYLKLK